MRSRARSKWLCESIAEIVEECYLMPYIVQDKHGSVNTTPTRGVFLRAAIMAYDWNIVIADDLAAMAAVQP